MGVWAVILLSVALSMDACTVAMTNGMTDSKLSFKKALLIGLFFGAFQMAMPLVGYFITGIVANAFMETFEKISAWISFILLGFLGGKMVWESVKEMLERRRAGDEVKQPDLCDTTGVCIRSREKLTVGKLTLQAVATSIDALAVGVTLQMAAISSSGLALGVWGATGCIGIVTFALSVGAVYIGKFLGDKLADKAGLFGGLVLLGIGIKLLLDGLL